MLIYDGDCGFCTACARWLVGKLRIPVTVIPWQEVHDLGALDLTRADVTTAAYYVDPYGRLHRGHRAAAQALRQCRSGWPVLGAVLGAPALDAVAGAVYTAIVRNRGRLPGQKASCRVPEPRSFTGASANV